MAHASLHIYCFIHPHYWKLVSFVQTSVPCHSFQKFNSSQFWVHVFPITPLSVSHYLLLWCPFELLFCGKQELLFISSLKVSLNFWNKNNTCIALKGQLVLKVYKKQQFPVTTLFMNTCFQRQWFSTLCFFFCYLHQYS